MYFFMGTLHQLPQRCPPVAFYLREHRRLTLIFSDDGTLGQAPERRPIRDSGSEDHFYSGPSPDGQPTLDDAITAREPHLSLALRNVRDMPPGNSVEADSAAEIVFHLATRTAHVRSSLGEGADLLLDGASRVFTDADNIAALVGLDAGEPTDLFREGVVNELRTNPVIAGWNLPPRLLERLAFMALKEKPHLLDENANFMAVLLSELRTRLPVAVRDGHNLALGHRGLPDDSYEALLRTLKWGVVNAPIAGAILPDCIVVAIDADGNAGTHLFAGRDGLHVIVMPVSPDKLLVGRRSGSEMPDGFDFNAEAARLSHSFFLAPSNDAEASRLHPMIGQGLLPMQATSIEDAFDGLLPKKSGEP